MSIYGNRFPENSDSSGGSNTDKRLIALENKTRSLTSDSTLQSEYLLDGVISQKTINTNIDNQITDINSSLDSIVDKTSQLNSSGQLGTFAIYDENEATTQEEINISNKSGILGHDSAISDLEDEITRLDTRIDNVTTGGGSITTGAVTDVALGKTQATINGEIDSFKTSTEASLISLNSSINARALITDVLTKTNTQVFTPTGPQHPATKDYVDTNILALTTDDITSTATNRFVSQAEKDLISTNETDITALQAELTAQQSVDTGSGDLDLSSYRTFARTIGSGTSWAITNERVCTFDIYMTATGATSLASTAFTHATKTVNVVQKFDTIDSGEPVVIGCRILNTNATDIWIAYSVIQNL